MIDQLYQRLYRRLQQHWPGQCLLCYGQPHDARDLCLGCQRDLPWAETICGRCGLDSEHSPCERCLREPPPWDAIYPVWHYGFPLNRLLNAWKHQGRAEAGRCLSQLWLQWQQVPQPLPDALIPVPLHWRRRWQRGFDQARILSREWAKAFDIEDIAAISRQQHTPAQQQLSARQRQRNLQGAFRLRVNQLPAHVALVDDVVTTGTTVSVLCELLHSAGCRRIDVWCLARTPPKGEG